MYLQRVVFTFHGIHNYLVQCAFIFFFFSFNRVELKDILGPVGSGHWILPLVHGSFQQKRFSLFGKCVDMIMIARRSRHYAGTRYLKRGINVNGKAANDCEVEQVRIIYRTELSFPLVSFSSFFIVII